MLHLCNAPAASSFNCVVLASPTKVALYQAFCPYRLGKSRDPIFCWRREQSNPQLANQTSINPRVPHLLTLPPDSASPAGKSTPPARRGIRPSKPYFLMSSTDTMDAASLQLPATIIPTLPQEFATVPASAPAIIKDNCIYIHAPNKIQSVVEDERRRNFQALVRRYMNQLLYGCERENCNTPTCYSSRKCLPRTSSASRRLTLLSARIMACTLASDADPLKALCPGKPIVPSLEAQKNTVQFVDQLDEDEKENRPYDDDRAKARPGRPRQKEVGLVTDKGLKDPRSFTQQLFNTVAMKMVEWIALPPPSNRTFSFSSQNSEVDDNKEMTLPSPQEPPKLKFPLSAMDVMDTGRLNKDSEPVTQSRHQEIIQQQTKKRVQSRRDVTPTPHSNAKAKRNSAILPIISPPQLPPLGIPHQPPLVGRRNTLAAQLTPTRGEKDSSSLWESAQPVTPPQCLKILDEDICKALMDMCTNSKSSTVERRVAKQFTKQSIFYVFSSPEAVLSSFGGIGSEDIIGFDPKSITRSLDSLYSRSWGEAHTKQSMWAGLAYVFAKPGKGMSDRDAAGLIILSLHVLSRGLVQDDEVFRLVTELRASGTVTSNQGVTPDIGFDDELAERLTKRVLKAISFRKARPGDSTISYVQQYLRKCEQINRADINAKIAAEFGPNMIGQVNTGYLRGGTGLARCLLEWTRSVFIRSWDGYEIVRRDSLAGSCIEVFELLYSDYASYGLFQELFETKSIGERISPYIWPVDWYNGVTPLPSPSDIHLLNHPYLFPVSYRVTYLRAINLDTMKKAYENAIANIRMAAQMGELTKAGFQFLSSRIDVATSIYFVLGIRRSNLLEDALNQLLHREHRELLRPLKIKFQEGEEGVDQGGVQQEFFSLLIQDILKPEYGMFSTDERTRLSWFWECSFEGPQKFELTGLVVGLAVYNGITLPVNFPKALYVKLLGGTPTLDDIDDYWPELARGLKQLLSWEDGDVEDVFMRTYEYSYSLFGEVRSINMLDAKEKGPEFLPRPIPSVKPKRIRVKEAVKKPPPFGDQWLPSTLLPIDPDARDPWLGLSELMDVLEDEHERSVERLRRLQSGETRYHVTYHDLNTGVTADGDGGSNTSDDGDVEGGAEASAESAEPEENTSSNYPGPPPAWVEVSNASQIKLPSDDGNDWEERSTVYSPTASSVDEREVGMIEPTPLDLEDYQVVVDNVHPAVDSVELSTSSSSSESPVQESTASSGGTAASSVHSDDASISQIGTAPEKPGLPALQLEIVEEEPKEAPATFEKPPEEPSEAPLVTNANREEFVKDYISWLTDRSIRRHYAAFARGFFSINTPRSLSLFSPASLQALIEGQPDEPIDVAALEAVCKYEDGYHAGHKVIHDFWHVVRGFSEEKKRLLLEFVTSSARVPIGGLGNVVFYIVRNGEDTERLPTSLTCFGRLLLPEYANRRKLKKKLELALENSKGFGSP
ncbi:hypothetical protein FN846DRAFT_941797 [Sphaerosporella brunnea]|uniref:HECT-type E3 ubiquitin transferase n=1 Tax=Sphaerosporella brunnea TaxID=1250544 RepID=A0A5J5F1H7_9PEZI|nr:hypothetical protein FN846DRAFT_941797 [Sphaerosporella brunnea]